MEKMPRPVPFKLPRSIADTIQKVRIRPDFSVYPVSYATKEIIPLPGASILYTCVLNILYSFSPRAF